MHLLSIFSRFGQICPTITSHILTTFLPVNVRKLTNIIPTLQVASIYLLVHFSVPPKLYATVPAGWYNENEVVEGSNVALSCMSTSHPVSNIRWSTYYVSPCLDHLETITAGKDVRFHFDHTKHNV